jgi:hypothetical protein
MHVYTMQCNLDKDSWQGNSSKLKNKFSCVYLIDVIILVTFLKLVTSQILCREDHLLLF